MPDGQRSERDRNSSGDGEQRQPCPSRMTEATPGRAGPAHATPAVPNTAPRLDVRAEHDQTSALVAEPLLRRFTVPAAMRNLPSTLNG
jgi:hypothetical protein